MAMARRGPLAWLASVLVVLACRGARSAPNAEPGPSFVFPDEGRVFDLTRESADPQEATQLEAPAANDPKGATVARIDPGLLVAPLYVIDVRERTMHAADFVLTADDLRDQEGRRGPIPP